MSEMPQPNSNTEHPPEVLHAEEQRDRLYDLLAQQGQEHATLLREVGTKIDHLTEACSTMSSNIQALQVTPSLLKLVAVALVAIVALAGAKLAIDGLGLHAAAGGAPPGAEHAGAQP